MDIRSVGQLEICGEEGLDRRMKTFHEWFEATETGGDPYNRKYPSRRLTDFYDLIRREISSRGVDIDIPVPYDIKPQEAEWVVDKFYVHDEGLKQYNVHYYDPRRHSIHIGDPDGERYMGNIT